MKQIMIRFARPRPFPLEVAVLLSVICSRTNYNPEKLERYICM